MKDDKYYITKIIIDIDFINKHMACIHNVFQFSINDLLVDSMLFRLIQISENINKISDSFKQKYKNIPWINIKGFRNKIVHEYGCVELSLVYDTLIKDIPLLKDIFENIIK